MVTGGTDTTVTGGSGGGSTTGGTSMVTGVTGEQNSRQLCASAPAIGAPIAGPIADQVTTPQIPAAPTHRPNVRPASRSSDAGPDVWSLPEVHARTDGRLRQIPAEPRSTAAAGSPDPPSPSPTGVQTFRPVRAARRSIGVADGGRLDRLGECIAVAQRPSASLANDSTAATSASDGS